MPFSQSELRKIFGNFSYKENPSKKGAIIISKQWIFENIIFIDTPMGRFPCHKKVAYQMENFINEAYKENLINDIGGIWVPRHIMWNPLKPLSGHAYGCDVDLNVDDGKDGAGKHVNFGSNSYQPQKLIDIARKWGLEWGGAWRSNKDGMHFSCVKIIDFPKDKRVISNNKQSKQQVNKNNKTDSNINCINKTVAGKEVKVNKIDKRSTNHNVKQNPNHIIILKSRNYQIAKLGSKGKHVKHIQQLLNNIMHANLAVDGIFGKKTEAAVKLFQAKNKLKSDGIIGPKTWSTLLAKTESIKNKFSA